MMRLSLLSLALSASAVWAQADYPCASSSDCGDLPTNNISGNSTCVADPLSPQYGYCGYVGASCETADDCDFGQCVNNLCYGYLGASCTSSITCLGALNCGATDWMCGGVGTSCTTNTDCVSNSCTNSTCAALPAAKMPVGSGCQVDAICASGYCGVDYICATRPMLAEDVSAAVPAPALLHAKTAAVHNRHRRDGRSHTRFIRTTFKKRQCTAVGETACLMGISSGAGLAFECIDTTSALESCGGCIPVPGSNETTLADPSAPAGVDCTALPNVEEVVCQSSRCKILACLPGSVLNPDGSACMLSV